MSAASQPCEPALPSFPSRSNIVLASTVANIKLLPRLGPRLLIIAGFVLSAAGFVLLTQLHPGTRVFRSRLPGPGADRPRVRLLLPFPP